MELDLRRLNRISRWLWIAGRPMPPRALHHQLLLDRDIRVTERMDMHLTWSSGRIFLKPIPRFLLDTGFWAKYLACKEHCACVNTATDSECNEKKAWKSALGFLFSYAALISHESDFHIAVDKHLIPPETKWSSWRKLVKQILSTDKVYQRINARFMYGELRLGRLNKIYYLSQRPFFRGYISHWHQYSQFLQDNFSWLASMVVYIAVVLTAMQVGLATKLLADNDAFQSASYGFAVFSILGPLIVTVLILLAFCYSFISNLMATIRYKQTRFRRMQAGPKMAWTILEYCPLIMEETCSDCCCDGV